MLTLATGPYHPALETGFVDRIRELKADPWSRIAVVAPSQFAADRLQQRLAADGLAALNLFFCTFDSFAHAVVFDAKPSEKPLMADPFFFETLIKTILKEDKPFEGAADLALPEGFPAAVRSTLHDLEESGATPAIGEAVKEGFLGKDTDVGGLRQLLRTYGLYLRRLDALPVTSHPALMREAALVSPDSRFLGSFREIIFYGFYDMTGLQADFFQAISKAWPVRLFFPFIPESPAYAFSSRFRDTFLQPVIQSEIRLSVEAPSAPADWGVMSVSGTRDEAWMVAQEILKSRASGVPYSQMAVVARTRERLGDHLLQALEDHSIPFRLSHRLPAGHFPQVLAASQLLELTDRDPLFAAELDFLKDPEFHLAPGQAAFLRPADWPEKSSWTDFSERTVTLLSAHFDSSDEGSRGKWGQIKASVRSLADFDSFKPQVYRGEFIETAKERWRGLEEGGGAASIPGVSLLHAEGARGLPFHTVFLIGLEERVFPRIIREDPFLRDDARFALSNTLGYKIDQKMTALEEERLLFHLIVSSARARICFFYQRTDEEGRIVGASPFLRAFVEERGLRMTEITRSVPRPFLAKIETAEPARLSPHALVAGLLAGGDQPAALRAAKALGKDADFLRDELENFSRLRRLDLPGPHDGLIGPDNARRLFAGRRLSATALETMGECPFRYFAVKLLELEPLEPKESEGKWAPDRRGEMVHAFLDLFYKKWLEARPRSLAGPSMPPEFPQDIFDAAFHLVFETASARQMKLYPVLWDALRVSLKERLKIFLTEDLAECRASGFTPRFFEREIMLRLGPPLDGPDWLGRMDRIDISATGARVVDYKTGRLRKLKVLTAALRGKKAQPPLYILLAERALKEDGLPVQEVSFVYKAFAKGDKDKGLSAEEWRSNRSRILETMGTQLRVLKEGAFVIQPSDSSDPYCGRCDVSAICRKNHGPSQFRAARGIGEEIRALRLKNGRSA